MSTSKAIHVILTGGTIDSYYDGIKDTAVVNKSSVIPQYIRSLKLYEKFIFSEICMKDSRDLTKTDLVKICSTVKKSRSNKIVVLHGTYTMSDTARYLRSRLKGLKKTIVFTGSMIPLVGFSPSDAPFNLGYAIAEVQTLKPGVFVVMNGNVFTPEEVMKLLHEGRFASVFGEKVSGNVS